MSESEDCRIWASCVDNRALSFGEKVTSRRLSPEGGWDDYLLNLNIAAPFRTSANQNRLQNFDAPSV
jgi:hypothetical protein